MNVGIITIGDELLIGQVVNRNAAWIAEKVTIHGGRVVSHEVVADTDVDIVRAIDALRTRVNLLVLTGGLGPTHDDITTQVLQNYFDNAEPTLLHNNVGTAHGIMYTHDALTLVALPGVPAEMQYIVANGLLPLISDRIAQEGAPTWGYRTLQTTGIAESRLSELIGDVKQLPHACTLAFLPNYHGVRLRIGVCYADALRRMQALEDVKAVIDERTGRYVFGESDDTIASAVGNLLKSAGATVSVAESCTGGLLGAAITEVPGSATYFIGGVISYSNDVKVHELGVLQEDLDSVGAVSREVAEQMARGVSRKLNTTYGISITGIAGPDGGTEEKTVGLVWIAVAGPEGIKVKRFLFGNDRNVNRQRSVGAALGMLYRMLKGLDD
ncbi:MAG: nicotinamide-nucleotide amidohydrolase family protein [bacterium]|nr:nicotinamide-nucleotide amidohydrolase family protein [bacterium]